MYLKQCPFSCCVILPLETLSPRRSEWGSSLPPDRFVSRGSISTFGYFLTWVFHGEALLAPRPTTKLEDHPSSAVGDCLFNLFAATLHIGGRFSIRNLRTHHAVVTGTHLTWKLLLHLGKCKIFQNTRITLFDSWRDSCYINIVHYEKQNPCKIRFKKSFISPN